MASDSRTSAGTTAERRGRGPVRRLLFGRVTALGVLFLGAAMLVQNSPLFEPSYEAIYHECAQILTRVRELSEKEATGADWAAIEQEATTKLAPLIAKLQKMTGQRPLIFGTKTNFSVNYFLRRPLLQIGKYDLPRLLQQGKAGKLPASELEGVEQALQRVRKSLDAVSLDVPTEGKGPPPEDD